MTIGRHDIIKWAISGVAFLGTIAVATGCNGDGKCPLATRALPPGPPVSSPPSYPSPPPPPTPSLLVSSPVPSNASVNVFGEIDGIPSGTASTSGQPASAAFQQHTFAADGRDTDVSVDPTGRWLAYSSTRHAEHPDLYLQKVDGVSVVRLTDDPADDAFPTFSPDGKTIAFCSTRHGNWDIFTMDTDGRQVVQVTGGSSHDLHPSFSPDGTRLVYSTLGSRSDAWELWVVDLATGQRRMIGYGLFPVWSPDKTVDRIAFQRARQRGSRWFSLWTLELVDGEARRVTEVAASSDAAIVDPAWSPDGQNLAYTTIRPSIGATPPNARDQKEIWTISADGAHRRRLTDGVGSNLSPVWAVDNRVYFVSDRGGAQSIWSVRATDAVAVPVAPAVAGAAQ